MFILDVEVFDMVHGDTKYFPDHFVVECCDLVLEGARESP